MYSYFITLTHVQKSITSTINVGSVGTEYFKIYYIKRTKKKITSIDAEKCSTTINIYSWLKTEQTTAKETKWKGDLHKEENICQPEVWRKNNIQNV